VVLDLLEAQPGARVDARLCTLGRAEGTMADAAHASVAFDGRYNKLWVVEQTARQVAQVIDELGPDILHTHGRDADIIGAVAAARRPVRHVAHLHITGEDRPRRNPRQWLKHAWMRRLWHRVQTRFIAVSEAVRQYHARHHGLDPQRIEVIRNGIRLEPFAEAAEGRANGQRGPDDAGPVTFGTAARLAPMKGLEGLIDAFARLNGRASGATLELAGTGKGRAALQQRVAERGAAERVRFLGHVTDMPGFYRGLDAFVLPSVSTEGLPLTVLEAMATGLPVVATSVGGTPEVLRDGVDGRVVSPGDRDALRGVIEELVADPDRRREMGHNARQRVREGFSRERMAQEVVDFYSRAFPRSARAKASH
jgi:glycosyltransferase involved in cell wall biosynthesis